MGDWFKLVVMLLALVVLAVSLVHLVSLIVR